MQQNFVLVDTVRGVLVSRIVSSAPTGFSNSCEWAYLASSITSGVILRNQAGTPMPTATKADSADIDFFYWPTPNGQKVAIFLEEAQLTYAIHPIDISKGVQFSPNFEKISPNNRMPAIVDRQLDVSIFESGAILLHLAERTGQFISLTPQGRIEVLQWLFWQMGGLGPILGQTVFFRNYAPEQIPLAIERFTKETGRLYDVLNKRLVDREYIAGDYSIADMAAYPWIAQYAKQGQSIENFPHVKRWLDRISQRDAVKRAYMLAEAVRPSQLTDEHRRQLYAQQNSRA
jgi:GSH-dependent disulfide-bond oxidoreductase